MKYSVNQLGVGAAAVLVAAVWLAVGTAQAVTPPPGPSSATAGVEGRIPSPPPTQAATIVRPANGQSFTVSPITVTGSCPPNSNVRIYNNGIFVGSAICQGGSYSLDISLFTGRNDLVAKVYDNLDQAGPDSATVTVNYSDPQFAAAGAQTLLTSQYARQAANVGDVIRWPLVLSGGSGPYAFAVNWGDGTPEELKSQEFAGAISFNHIYKNAGIYQVIIKVVDRNGSSYFLQVIAVINGDNGTGNGNGTGSSTAGSDKDKNATIITKTRTNWQIPLALIVLLPFGFWLGRHAELTALRKRLEREYARSLDDDE